MPRIFTAVRVPDDLCRAIGRVEDELRPRIFDVKWVQVENLHLTLRFFGYIEAAQLDTIVEVTRSVTRSATPFTIELSGLGCFPDRGRPRVFWIGLLAGAERLVALASELNRAYEEAGLGPEDRPFRPHLTIGRQRETGRSRRTQDRRGGDRRGADGRRRIEPPAPPQAVPEIREALAATSFGPLTMPVSSVQVVESILRRQGPRYDDVAAMALGGATQGAEGGGPSVVGD